MTAIPVLSEPQLQAICNILADTSLGLSGSEISKLLVQCNIYDPQVGSSKRERLYHALSQKQKQDHCANNTMHFIQVAMDPVRYVQNPAFFESRREILNQALIFAGYALGEDGKIRETTAARKLSDAEQRAGVLKRELQRRNVHPDVLRYCRAELLQENYFHAVLEATKSVAEKIRQKTNLTGDGADLVDQAFGLKNGPMLAINKLETDSERSEHTGFMNLVKGLFGTFRNPTSHTPKIDWVINEQDALDLLTMVSYIHRRLDGAVPTISH
jgi:uncharacterized protein (TIGR02391 family)